MSQVASPPTAAAVTDRKAGPILRATGLRKSFQMGDQTLAVVKGVDLSLRPGEFVAIEGRSGSGKSTLLHMMGALEAADEGTVEFQGVDYTRRPDTGVSRGIRILTSRWFLWGMIAAVVVAAGAWLTVRAVTPDADSLLQYEEARNLQALGLQSMSEDMKAVERDLALADRARTPGLVSLVSLVGLAVPYLAGSTVKLVRYLVRDRASAGVRNREFGFVFQFYHLLPELNVLENTMLSPMIQFSWPGFFGRRAELRARATAILEQLGMGHRLRHRPNQLSGGERQRVAIARALMNSPRVLFADEPTGNLDAETGRQIMGVLEKLHQEQGQTIVMVTHDRTLARRADRVLVMKDGKLERAES
jgi:ABC-type lipoprotein export system ATPase subunit